MTPKKHVGRRRLAACFLNLFRELPINPIPSLDAEPPVDTIEELPLDLFAFVGGGSGGGYGSWNPL